MTEGFIIKLKMRQRVDVDKEACVSFIFEDKTYPTLFLVRLGCVGFISARVLEKIVTQLRHVNP